LSRRRSTTSKRERRGEGRPVLTEIERSWSYLRGVVAADLGPISAASRLGLDLSYSSHPLPFGLHAAKTEHFVRSLQTRPA